MSNLLFAYQNYAAASAGATITADPADSSYPATRAQDGLNTTRCWLAAAAGTLTIDLGSAKAVQFCALINHNLPEDAQITIAAHTADAWGAPDFGPETVTWRTRNAWKKLTAAETYRYWQFTLDLPAASFGGAGIGGLPMPLCGLAGPLILTAGVPDSQARVAEVFLGPCVTASGNFGRDHGRGISLAGLMRKALFGAARFAVLAESGTTWNLTWPAADSTARAQLEALHEAVYGAGLAFAVVPDGSTVAYWVRAADERQSTHAGHLYADYMQETWQLTEELIPEATH